MTHTDDILKQGGIPMSAESIALFNQLHILARKKEATMTMRFDESGMEWSFTLDDSGDNVIHTRSSSTLDVALKRAVEAISKFP